MGNCMETCCIIMRQQEEVEMKEKHDEEEEEEEEEGKGKIMSGFVVNGSCDDDKGKNGGARVKVVLTKEELKWLILQLSEKGGMKLEQVLQEIERGRGGGAEKVVEGSPWKPSLESILEAPEMLEIDR